MYLFTFFYIVYGRCYSTSKPVLRIIQMMAEHQVFVLVQLVVDVVQDFLERPGSAIYSNQFQYHSLVFLRGTEDFKVIAKFVSASNHFSSIKSNRRTASGFQHRVSSRILGGVLWKLDDTYAPSAYRMRQMLSMVHQAPVGQNETIVGPSRLELETNGL